MTPSQEQLNWAYSLDLPNCSLASSVHQCRARPPLLIPGHNPWANSNFCDLLFPPFPPWTTLVPSALYTMSTMTFVVPNRQEPDTLSVLQVFGTKTQTFWGSLSAQPRVDSVNSSIYRSFSKQTAWDISGPVLDHWNEVLVHAVHATFTSHRNDILRGRAWDGAINCWMIGDRTECALPKVVVSCIDLPTVKRFMRKIIKDACWQSSGFDLVGRRGCLKYTTGDSKEDFTLSTSPQFIFLDRQMAIKALGPQTRTPETVEFSGLEVLIQSRARPFKEEEMKSTTVGGLILVEDAFYCLCVAHAFLPCSPTNDNQRRPPR